MPSNVEIANNALIALGANTISSLTEQSSEAVACNTVWERIRTSLLRLHPWNFAIKRMALAKTATTPAFRYKYSYQIPSDNIRIMRVYEDYDYKIEGNLILTDKEDCFVKYVFDNDVSTTWDASFVHVMVMRLRVELAYTLTRSSTEVQLSQNLYQIALDEARSIDATTDIEDLYGQNDNTLISTRYL